MKLACKQTPDLNKSLVTILTSVIFTCVLGSFRNLDNAQQNQVKITHRVENLATLSVTQSNRTQRIQFAPGTSATTVEDTVIRGTRDVYFLDGKGGQVIHLELTSVENNAVFELITPQGESILQETSNWKGILPETGDYQIVIGGVRGNSTYDLGVKID